MVDLVPTLIKALIELFFGATGKHLLRLFGLQRKIDDFASFFTGMAFWAVVGIVAYVITPR